MYLRLTLKLARFKKYAKFIRDLYQFIIDADDQLFHDRSDTLVLKKMLTIVVTVINCVDDDTIASPLLSMGTTMIMMMMIMMMMMM